MKLALLSLLVITSISFSSCRKKIDTTANIYVRDETNALIDSAMVILYGENTSENYATYQSYNTKNNTKSYL